MVLQDGPCQEVFGDKLEETNGILVSRRNKEEGNLSTGMKITQPSLSTWRQGGFLFERGNWNEKSCSLNTKEKKGKKNENAVSEIGTENQKE